MMYAKKSEKWVGEGEEGEIGGKGWIGVETRGKCVVGGFHVELRGCCRVSLANINSPERFRGGTMGRKGENKLDKSCLK